MKAEPDIPLVLTNSKESNTEMLLFLIESIKNDSAYKRNLRITEKYVNKGWVTFLIMALFAIAPIVYFILSSPVPFNFNLLMGIPGVDLFAAGFASLMFGFLIGGFFSIPFQLVIEEKFSGYSYMRNKLEKMMEEYFEVSFENDKYNTEKNVANFISVLEVLTKNDFSEKPLSEKRFTKACRQSNGRILSNFATYFLSDVKKMGLQKENMLYHKNVAFSNFIDFYKKYEEKRVINEANERYTGVFSQVES